MKKFTALAFAVLFMMFVTSCGSDKKTDDTLPDSEITDEDAVDEDPSDTGTDTTPDNPEEPAGKCGDNNVDEGEVCDGSTTPCTEISSEYSGGYAFCKEDCSGWDESSCRKANPDDTDTTPDNPDTDTNDDDTDTTDTGTNDDDTDTSDTGTNDDDADTETTPDEDDNDVLPDEENDDDDVLPDEEDDDDVLPDEEGDDDDTDTDTDDSEYSIGYAAIQHPTEDQTLDMGNSLTVYGRVYVAGITDATPNTSEETIIKAQFCLKETDDADFTCEDADVNTGNHDSGNNDEYQYSATFNEEGQFIAKYRFSVDNGANWIDSENQLKIFVVDDMERYCPTMKSINFDHTEGEEGWDFESWQKKGTSVTFTDVTEGLKIETSYNGNQEVLYSNFFESSAHAEIPVGISFKMATLETSHFSIDVGWSTGTSQNSYNAYNWNPDKKVFEYAGDSNSTYHDYGQAITFGDTAMHDTYIVFGPEIAEHWRGYEKLHIRIRTGKSSSYGSTSIIINDFKVLYAGGACGNMVNYTISNALLQWPLNVEEVATTPVTFYGRVKIAGLTDLTPNKSEFLMGVRAQFGIRPEGTSDFVWDEVKDAAVNTGNNDSGEYDEYMYTYTFKQKGNFEYSFRFSTDNGNTWTTASSYGTATILPLTKAQIPNGDLSQWENDTTPIGYAKRENSNNTTFTRIDLGGGNYALEVAHKKDVNMYTFDTPEFITTEDTLVPTALKFQLATNSASYISINLKCGSGDNSQKFYNWNGSAFANANSNSYTNQVNLSEGFHQITIDLTTSVDADFWQDKTCKVEFKQGKNSAFDITVDDFEFVYPED